MREHEQLLRYILVVRFYVIAGLNKERLLISAFCIGSFASLLISIEIVLLCLFQSNNAKHHLHVVIANMLSNNFKLRTIDWPINKERQIHNPFVAFS